METQEPPKEPPRKRVRTPAALTPEIDPTQDQMDAVERFPTEKLVPLFRGLTKKQLDWYGSLSKEDRLRLLTYQHQLRLQRCRENPLAFGEYVMRDEQTQKPIVQGPIHVAMHRILNTQRRAVIFSHVESGKTTSVAIARTLFEIGRRPEIRIGLLSSSEGNAGERLTRVVGYIEESPEYREVFPHIGPSVKKGDKWIPGERITVARAHGPQHPTVRAIGLHTAVLSWRCDLLIGDDVLEFKHVISKGERDKVMRWWSMSIAGRFVDMPGYPSRGWLMGVPHHKQDLLNQVLRRGWKGFRFPVEEQDGKLNSPGRWPKKRIEQAKIEMGPFEAARQLYCIARDDADSSFKDEWIEAAMEAGAAEGAKLLPSLPELPEGCVTVTGVDIGVAEGEKADSTVFFTILIDEQKRRWVIDVWAGKISGPEIARKCAEIHRRYHSMMVVESVVAQRFVVQMLREIDPDVPVIAFNTKGSNKWHPAFGVQSIGAEFSLGRWIIPNEAGALETQVYNWIQEMKDFRPGQHTGDRLMASWFAREGARQLGLDGSGGSISIWAVGVREERNDKKKKKTEEIAATNRFVPSLRRASLKELMELEDRPQIIALEDLDPEKARDLFRDGEVEFYGNWSRYTMIAVAGRFKAILEEIVAQDIATPVGVLEGSHVADRFKAISEEMES